MVIRAVPAGVNESMYESGVNEVPDICRSVGVNRAVNYTTLKSTHHFMKKMHVSCLNNKGMKK